MTRGNGYLSTKFAAVALAAALMAVPAAAQNNAQPPMAFAAAAETKAGAVAVMPASSSEALDSRAGTNAEKASEADAAREAAIRAVEVQRNNVRWRTTADENSYELTADGKKKPVPADEVRRAAAGVSAGNDSIIIVYFSNGTRSDPKIWADEEGYDADDKKVFDELTLAAQTLIYEGFKVTEFALASSDDGVDHVEVYIDGYEMPGAGGVAAGSGGLTLAVIDETKENWAMYWELRAERDAKRAAEASGAAAVARSEPVPSPVN